MRAVVVDEAGGPEVLRWTDGVDDPVAGPGEVVVEVVATAVNRADVLQRQGFYPPPPGASDVLGLECSGRVAELGDGVEGWSVGDEVCALLSGGGYAERVAVPAGQLLPVPAGVGLVDAAGLPEVVCTVWSNLVMTARLGAGDRVLVHGGTGGIGTCAIQVATHVGAWVATTVGTTEKVPRVRELGADLAVVHREQDFVAEVREATDGRGVDVVLDVVGGPYLGRNVDVLATGGRLVVIGMQGGRKGELDLGRLIAKRAWVTATTLRARPPEEKAEIVAAVREHVWPAVEAGAVRVVVDQVLPLAEVAEAHRALDRGEHVGKVVMTTGQAA